MYLGITGLENIHKSNIVNLFSDIVKVKSYFLIIGKNNKNIFKIY
jgi:hypothetical protein